jgi:hypothetical protein
MADLASVMNLLRAQASAKTRATYVRHGMPAERTFGVSVAALKTIVKSIRKQQTLALELYATGIFEAMYLAGMVADGRQMTELQLQSWAQGCEGMPMIAEYTVPWVAVESATGRRLARQWIESSKEQMASAGWSTLAGEVATLPDAELDLAAVRELVRSIPARVPGATNRARYTMNVYVISVGGYVAPLYDDALAMAAQLGKMPVDVGDTACKVPVATDYIAKMHARGPVKKRKTLRC